MQVSAPGRVCLYGEHQDYLGLPVIPAAVGRRTTVRGGPIAPRRIAVSSAAIEETDQWPIDAVVDVGAGSYRYLRGVTNELRERYGWRPARGFDVRIESDVPFRSGVSSSAALLVSFAGFVAAHEELELDAEALAYLAYRAERHWCGVACGQMDQYASALGGLIFLEPGPMEPVPESAPAGTRRPPAVARLANPFRHLVIGDSRERRSADQVLRSRQEEMTRIRGKLGLTDFEAVPLDMVADARLDDLERRRLECVLRIRDMTRAARAQLDRPAPELSALGRLLTDQHAELRDNFQVSSPALDRLVQAALDGGALGAKLTGAGLAGCIVAVAGTADTAQRVARAIDEAGGRAWLTTVGTGVQVG